VVDFGSNIGISALYFVPQQPGTYVYCYEPLPRNIERLRKRLAHYQGQYERAEIAVGESDGTVRFGWEPTGRYGGVGRDTGRSIDVQWRDSDTILNEIVAKHGHIDLLKADIEGSRRRSPNASRPTSPGRSDPSWRNMRSPSIRLPRRTTGSRRTM
jgi:FkbM family methyltransferase